jgi:hypothetical protein
LLVASLCRTVPETDSLLGPFTAHVFQYPTIWPQRPDPWTFPRYVRELWWWVKEEGFEEVLRQAARDGSRANRAVLPALDGTDSLARLWQALRSLGTAVNLEDFLQRHHPFADEHAAAWTLLHELVDGTGLRAGLDDTLRHQANKTNRHWLVPVWYLAQVERLLPEQIVARLLVDDDEAAAVAALASKLAPPLDPCAGHGMQPRRMS